MIANKQPPNGATSSGRDQGDRTRGDRTRAEKHVPRENERLDLARLSPQQIAAELARRSQAQRPVETREEEKTEEGAGIAKSREEASPFERLAQVWSPAAEERRRLKEQYVEERYRWEDEQDRRQALKLREGVEDGSGIGDDTGDDRGEDVVRRDDAAKEWAARVERNIDAINAKLRGDSPPQGGTVLGREPAKSQPTISQPASPQPAVQSAPVRAISPRQDPQAGDLHARGYHDFDLGDSRPVPARRDRDETALRNPFERQGRDDPALGRQLAREAMTGHASTQVSFQESTFEMPLGLGLTDPESKDRASKHGAPEDREPRLRATPSATISSAPISDAITSSTTSPYAAITSATTVDAMTAGATPLNEAASGEADRPRLTVPEDVRNLVTTSFERPAAPSQRHHHGVLIIFSALVLGLVLYFHPWSKVQEGPVHSDLPGTAANTAGNPPAKSPLAPAPAAPMTPLSAQSNASTGPSAPSSAPATPPAASTPTNSSTMQPAAPAPVANAPVTPPAQPAPPPTTTAPAEATAAAPSTPTQQATPQATTPQATTPQLTLPKQSLVPAETAAPSLDALKSAQPLERNSGPATTQGTTQATTNTAGKASGDKAQSQVKRDAAATVKPSPAWLHVQPYGGGSEASPLSGPNTPDAWMKPQPYREPGVLTPPN